ncbi:MAG: chalcone isomerase family protein [Candidatus Dactylopiibacterium sp.]|nr:chalcone isomerase family protein [Candidatus Dactylopiibacterium sp.]
MKPITHSILRRALAASALAALIALPAQAAQVAGVSVPDSAQTPQGTLLLNGAGLRTRLVFKVYVAALYLPQKSSQAAAIIEGNGPRRVVLHMLRNIEGPSLLDALRDGLYANLPEAELEAVKAPVAELEKIFFKVGRVSDGDRVQIDLEGGHVRVSVNGQPHGDIASAALGRALLRIWLGEQPVSAELKRALLGQ